MKYATIIIIMVIVAKTAGHELPKPDPEDPLKRKPNDEVCEVKT